jgi:hypothetical protein
MVKISRTVIQPPVTEESRGKSVLVIVSTGTGESIRSNKVTKPGLRGVHPLRQEPGKMREMAFQAVEQGYYAAV